MTEVIQLRRRAADFVRRMPRTLARQRADWRDHIADDAPVTWTPTEAVAFHEAHLISIDSPSIDDWQSFYRWWLLDFGDVPLREHTQEKWVAWLGARRADVPPLKEKTLDTRLGLATGLYSWLISKRAIELNPIRDIPRAVRPKRKKPNAIQQAQRVFSREQMRLILGLDGLVPGFFFDHLLVAGAVCLGARFGELAGLERSDYLTSFRPLPAVRIEKQLHQKQRKLRSTKDKWDRTVPVHPHLRDLFAQVPDQMELLAGRAWRADDPLFPFIPSVGMPDVRRWRNQTAGKRMRMLLAELSIPPPATGKHHTPHNGRHTMATRMRAAGANAFAVRAMTHPSSAGNDAHGDYLHLAALEYQALCDAVLTVNLEDLDLVPDSSRAIDAATNQLTFGWESEKQ